jgi:shikimate dehydrogenase
MHRTNDFRLTINKDTRMCMSLAARPGNFGTRLHNYLYAHLHLNYFYKSFTTNNLAHAVAGVRALAIRGCAISMPFKEEVMAYLDHMAPSAARIDAVNTIVNDGGVLTGFNTDYIAIQRLFENNGIPIEASIAVFGSGGMAKAIASALDDCGYRQVTIVARNAKTGQRLAAKYGYRWRPQWVKGEVFEVLVNASPVGMAPNADQCPCPEALIRQAQYIVDSVANPIHTQLIQTATQFGKSTVSGAEITKIQSIEQFKLYTGVTPDEKTVQSAMDFVLGFDA